MAANYWDSTQRRYWQFTKEELAVMRENLEDKDLVHMFPLPQLRHLNIYFNQQINRLGKRLGVRQQAMATAQVYIKRFYSKVEIRRTNPYLVISTAVYLACKMEECPQHIRLLVQEARSLWPADFHHLDTGKVGECEFFLISEMNSQLIIHQPYRSLTTLQADFGLAPEEANLAWCVVNDHYMTDLPLLYPPHIIAVTAILLALVLRPSGPSAVPGGGGGGAGGGSGGSGGAAGVMSGAGGGGVNVGSIAAVTAALQQAQARAVMAGGSGGGGGGGAASGMTTQSSSQGEAGEKKGLLDGRAGKVHRFAAWLADSNVDIEAMVDCTQELISFYECHEQYNEKLTREQITRFVKARGLDK